MNVTLASGIACAVVILVVLVRRSRQVKPRAPWGEWPDDARDLSIIARYVRTAELAGGVMDDRTWEDLNLDDVFRLLDRTESLVGQQVLYARLRAMPAAAHLPSFDALATQFERDVAARNRAAAALRQMRRVDGHDLRWLTEPDAVTVTRWHAVFPIVAAVVVVSVLLVPWHPILVFVVAAGVLVNLTLRAIATRRSRIAERAFRHVGPVLVAARALGATDGRKTEPLTEALDRDLPDLAKLYRVSRWMSRDAGGAAAGDLGGIVFEYLNGLLALDGNALFFGAGELRRRGPALRRVVHAIGEVDAALSVASYRAGTRGWTRPEFGARDGRTVLRGLRHPLIPEAIANSMELAPPHGVIITGSNMSGKTTFLRALGVATVMAQTVHTCTAEAYAAPAYRVCGCIGRADDPTTGKSYYLVEVDSVLGLLRAAEAADPHLILFDELFRGTNTVERIAAAEAVLASLRAPGSDGRERPHVIVVATHDRELVDLLDTRFAAYHFQERVDDRGLTFDYLIRPGAARGRNAIALLRLRGAPAGLVEHATARADALDRVADGRAVAAPMS